MPSRPPSLRAKPRTKPSNWTKRESRQARGYDRAHDLMRERVLREEPLCRMCLAKTPPKYTRSGIADHIVPKAEGGTDERSNYQALGYDLSPRHPDGCDCHRSKTARESARARLRARS